MKTLPIPAFEQEIILGTLLGDGSLVVQTDGYHRLTLCQGAKQEEYLRFKVNLLPSIFMAKPVRHTDENRDQFHCGSISHPWLTEVHRMMYRKRKFVSRRVLDLLSNTSLLIWYLDDGTLIKASGNAIILCTDSFSISENRAIKSWLWQRFRVRAFLMPVQGGYSDKIYHRLRFRKKDSNLLFRLMRESPLFPQLPENMRYKFPSDIDVL